MADKPKRTIKGKPIESLDVSMPEAGKTFPAKIVGMLKTTAKEVFGAKAKEPEKPVVVISFEGEEGIAGTATISYSKVPNAKSNLYKFLKRYREAPHKGQTVQVAQDEDGFWRLAIE